MKLQEYGSDFHFPFEVWLEDDIRSSPFFSSAFALYFSGRSALASILEEGIHKFGWQKVYFPSYYCHEVPEYLSHLSIEIEYYSFNPFLDPSEKDLSISDDSSSVIVNVDFFGLNKLSLDSYSQAFIIDDLTHNIFSYDVSNAAYCFGSLRKELPVPVGGFCYSPLGYPLPAAPKDFSKGEEAAVKKLTAMFLKREYIMGNKQVNKALFRELFQSAEEEFALVPINSAMPRVARALLGQLDLEKIRTRKAINIKEAIEGLGDIKEVSFNMGHHEAAFALVVEFPSRVLRDELKTFLIAQNIFPVILWPGQMNESDRRTEDRILVLHMDYRHEPKDVQWIVKKVRYFFGYA